MMDRKHIDEPMDMLGLDVVMDKMAKANGVRWYENALRKENHDILQKAVKFKTNKQNKRGRPKMT